MQSCCTVVLIRKIRIMFTITSFGAGDSHEKHLQILPTTSRFTCGEFVVCGASLQTQR